MKERLMFYCYMQLVQGMVCLHLSGGCRLMVWSSLPFDLELYKQAERKAYKDKGKREVFRYTAL